MEHPRFFSFIKHPPTPRPVSAGTLLDKLTRGDRPRSRKEMTAAHQLDLIGRHPGLYRLASEFTTPHEPFSYDGFTVFDGWFKILSQLSARLAEDPSVVAAQVKEKDGVLKFHCLDRESPEVAAAIAKASAESAHTCEICGDEGFECSYRMWAAVRCEPCEALDKAEAACRELALCLQDIRTMPPEAVNKYIGSFKRCLVRLGAAAELQSPERRARLPGVDWARLDQFRPASGQRPLESHWRDGTSARVDAMTAAEVLSFMKNDLPALEEALR